MNENKRKHPRAEIACEGIYRPAHGGRGQATVYDVSPEGCSFRDESVLLADGRRLKIWFAAVGPFEGVVRWIDRNVVGMQFDKPIYPPVFEHLCQSLGWDEATCGRRVRGWMR